MAHAPRTDDGAAVWGLILNGQTQIRVGFAGIIGLDFPAFFQMASALGIDAEALAILLPYADAGLRAGVAKLKARESDKE